MQLQGCIATKKGNWIASSETEWSHKKQSLSGVGPLEIMINDYNMNTYEYTTIKYK